MTSLPDAEQLLRIVVDEASDYAFIVMDETGCIERWNPGAQSIFGFPPETILGRHFSALFTVDDVSAGAPESELETARIEGRALDSRWHVRNDGKRFFADGITSALRDSTSSVIGYVKIARDVTQLKAAEEDRRRLLVREQRLNQEKDDFFAAVSHELRTPLTAISGWLELIDRDTSDRQLLREGVTVLRQATQSLSKLVDDLFDAVRTRTGKMRVDAQPTNLTNVFREAIQAFRLAVERRHLTIHEDIEDDITVLGDATRLHQIIWNLLSNAVRHNVPGGSIDARLRSEGGEAVLEVRDTGEGIDPELLPLIFEPFRQKAGGQAGGLGLGLTIARSLVELHGGRIMAESDGPGTGATFRISLPLLDQD